MQVALLQHILNGLQPRFAALRGEKDTAEQIAAGLATQVSCHLSTSSSLGLPVNSVWLTLRQAISSDAKWYPFDTLPECAHTDQPSVGDELQLQQKHVLAQTALRTC